MNARTQEPGSEQTADRRRRRRKERYAKSRTPEPKNIVSGAGQPLDPGVRRELEEQLGHDLSRVRLHTGRDAGQLAELLGADAVAVGQDILFREGAFKPGTDEGRRLLAHELLHTVQNPHGLGALRAGRELGAVSLPQQAVEREAETAAQDLVRPRSAPSAESAPEVEQGRATPGWLRYATVDADRARAERIDPETLVDRLVNDVLRSLRGDPEDASGRVRLHLGRMSPDLQDLVLDRLEIRLPTPEHDRLLDLADEVEEGPLPLEAATAPHALPDAAEELEQERESAEAAWRARLDDAERLEDERIAQAQRRKAGEPEADSGASGKAGRDTGDASAVSAPAAGAVPQGSGSTTSAETSEAEPLQVADGSREEDAGSAPDSKASAPAGEPAARPGEPRRPAPPARTAAKDSPVRRAGAVQPEPVDKSAAERDDTRAPAPQETASGTDQDPDDEPLGLEQGGAAEALAELEELLDEAEEDVGTEPETAPGAEDTPLPTADSETAAVGSGAPGRTSGTDPEHVPSGRPREPRVTAEDADDLASLLEDDSPREDTAEDPPDTADDLADERVGPDPESGTADDPGPAVDPVPATDDDQADRAEDRDLASETRRANERQGGDESDATQGEAGAPGRLARADEDARGQETGSPSTGGGAGSGGPTASAPDRAATAVASAPAPAAVGAPGPAAGGDTGVGDRAVEVESATPRTEAPPRHEPARQDDDTPVVAKAAAPRGSGGGTRTPGGAGGGGRAAAKPGKQATAPDVGNATPEAGLAVAESLQPHQALTALKGVDTAVGRSVGKERGALKDAPPSMDRPVGSPMTVHGGPKPGEPGAYTSEQVRQTEAPPGSTPEIKGDKAPDGQLPGAEMKEPGWWDITIAIGGALARKLLSKLLPLDKLTDSIDELPSADKGLQGSKVGDAPRLPLKDDSDPERTDKQARLLDDKSAELHESGRDDAARPMGEDRIYPDVPGETLTASLPGGGPRAGGEGGPAGSPGAGLPPEAVSAVAEHEQGPQIKQAFGQARQKMTTARKEKDDKARRDRGQYERDVRREVDANSKEQADARDEGRTDIARSRDGWRKEQDDKLDEVDGRKSKKFTKVRKDIRDKQDKTDQDVDQRTKDDQKKIDDRRDGSEQAVRQKRDDGKKDSGNWFEKGLNWIKDQFNKLKQAIKDVFEKARNFVKGVIDDFKKQVFKFIDDARKWVIDQINAFADELIRLGDELLKDYPALQAKWRRTINGLRDAAVRKVNQAADRLKKIAGRLIDSFGGLLLAGLDLMEQGLLAAVNLAETVTVKAMELGAAILKGLGEWAAIATDILSDPGGWLGKAKDAAVTGAREHLFTEIKSAVREWFNQKIQQLIGIPMEMFNRLISGGVSKEEMARMAWDEVVPQLPMIIGELIVTKVVAKLIPGAGWVMAVIDALKTAYEALSSVLRAFGLFMNFLKSVKSGNGALPFAKAVASGVVALLELIYQWLVSGIGKYLGKVARTLRERAGKLFGKGRPGGRPGEAPKREDRAPRKDDPAARPAAPRPHRPEPEPTPGHKPDPAPAKSERKPDDEDRRRDGRYVNAADRGVRDAAHEAKSPSSSRPGGRRPGDRAQDRPGTKRPNGRRPDGRRPGTTEPGDKRRPDLRKPDRDTSRDRTRTDKNRDRGNRKEAPSRRRPLQRVGDAVRKALAKVRRATRALLGKARDLRNRLRNLAKRLRDKWQRMRDRLLGRQRHERDKNRKDRRDRNATQDVDLPKVHFTDREDGEPHTLMFHGRGRRAPLFIHSTPEEAPAFLADWKADLRKPEAAADKAKQEAHLAAAEQRYAEAKEIQKKIPSPIKKEDRDKYRPLFTELRLKMKKFGDSAALRTHYDVPTPPDYPKWFDVKSPRGSAGHRAGFLSDAAKTVFGGPGKDADDARTGQPPGWLWLRSKRMTTGSAWVRMHLLPERLGGAASGNNLVPARGPQTNIDFLNNIEDRAYREIPKQEKIIWYRTEVQFNHAEWPDFPSRIHAEYGGYTKVGGTGKNKSDWSPKGVKWQHTQNPQPPREDEAGMLFINSAGRTTLQSVLMIGPRLADYVVEMRDKLKKEGSKFDNLGQFKLLMRARKRELGDRAMPDIEVLFANLAKLDADERKVDWN